MNDAEMTAGPKSRMSRGWRITLWLTVVALIVTSFYAEENWRGRHAWERHVQKLAEKGHPVYAQQVIPQPVPGEDNFAMTPFLAPLFRFAPGTQKWVDTNGTATAQHLASELDPIFPLKGDKTERVNSWVIPRVNMESAYAAL